jgi:hypothetical protein
MPEALTPFRRHSYRIPDQSDVAGGSIKEAVGAKVEVAQDDRNRFFAPAK